MDAALTPSSDAEPGEPTGPPPPGAAPPAPVEPLAPPPADEELAAGFEAGPGKVTLCGKAATPRQAALAGAA